jgi:chromosome segregation ATPase
VSNNKKKIFFIGCLIIFVFCLLQAGEGQKLDLQTRLEILMEQIAKAESALRKIQPQIQKKEEEIEKLTQKINTLKKRKFFFFTGWLLNRTFKQLSLQQKEQDILLATSEELTATLSQLRQGYLILCLEVLENRLKKEGTSFLSEKEEILALYQGIKEMEKEVFGKTPKIVSTQLPVPEKSLNLELYLDLVEVRVREKKKEMNGFQQYLLFLNRKKKLLFKLEKTFPTLSQDKPKIEKKIKEITSKLNVSEKQLEKLKKEKEKFVDK